MSQQKNTNSSSLPIIVKEQVLKYTDDASITEMLTEGTKLNTLLTEEQKINVLKERYLLKEEVIHDKMFVNEISLSWAGKLFFASAAAYIAGKVIKNMPLKVKGSKEQLTAIANVIVSSKAFQDELKKPGASIESVVKKMNLRNMSRQEFKRVTGKDFPL